MSKGLDLRAVDEAGGMVERAGGFACGVAFGKGRHRYRAADRELCGARLEQPRRHAMTTEATGLAFPTWNSHYLGEINITWKKKKQKSEKTHLNGRRPQQNSEELIMSESAQNSRGPNQIGHGGEESRREDSDEDEPARDVSVHHDLERDKALWVVYRIPLPTV